MELGIEYRVVRERLYRRELGSYLSYGIVAVGADKKAAYIPDISTEEWKVANLADKLNRLGASLTHFLDIVEDSLD